MPYLDDHVKRGAISRAVEDMQVDTMDSAELNFTLCMVYHEFMRGQRKYARFAWLFGSVILSLLEYWRRVVAPYEDRKARENGDLPWL